MESAPGTTDYGRRLLPHVVDEASRENPDRIVYSFPITNDPSKGFHNVSCRRYANAVNRTAWFIEQSFGQPEPMTFPSIGYIAPNDLRYSIVMVAAVKVGYKMVFLSPRNSIEGHLAVIDKADCKLWALPSVKVGPIDRIFERREMKVVAFPDLLELLDESVVQEYPYPKTFAEARQEPFVVLHTSGSTGLPKPIVVPHGYPAVVDAQRTLPLIGGRPTIAQLLTVPYRAYVTFPSFHAAGIMLTATFPFYLGMSVVMGPPSVPVNLDLINAMFDHGELDASFLAPSSIEEISKDPDSLKRVGKTKFIAFGGGPLSQEAGDQVSKVCEVFNFIGLTEACLFPTIRVDAEDWNYFHFHPYAGFEYRQRTDELFDQFQIRDPKFDLQQAYFQTFPNEKEWAVRDLYSKHPTKPNLFRYRGRADDVIVLSNGEKVNPLDMEACISNHPEVKACLIVGQGKFQTTVLIELRNPFPATEDGVRALKESLWKKMEEANVEAPAHGRLQKEYIIFAKQHKPFLLAGKGTVLRGMTTRLYEEEIDHHYKSVGSKQPSNDVFINVSNLEAIQKGISDFVGELLHHTDLKLTDDFFAHGLDSLLVFRLMGTLRSTLKSTGIDDRLLKPSLIYSNPTIEQLSKAVNDLLRPASGSNESLNVVELMKSLVETYTAGLSARASPKEPLPNSKLSVILTGSTGSLGSYILEDLLAIPNISRVFCLNRTINAKERQIRTNQLRGLQTALNSPRVIFLHADLSKSNLGLSKQDYDELLQHTTHIIHNQWQVDFNLSLSSFEPHIRGVRHLVDFAIESSLNPSLFYISSVGVARTYKVGTTIPETMLTDFAGPGGGGYGSSKLVSEWILEEAAATAGVTASICRVGQIAGPINLNGGVWNKQEWLPSLIFSSKHLRMAPATLGSNDTVNWLPVNSVSRMIVELAELADERDAAERHSTAKIFHGVNPQAVSWKVLLPEVVKSLGSDISVVPWSTWLSELEQSEKDGNLDQNPGLKLLDFYRTMSIAGTSESLLHSPVFETKNTELHSKTLRTLGPVRTEWMHEWMLQWGF